MHNHQRDFIKLVIVLAVSVLLVVSLNPSAAIIMQPYLSGLTANSVYVLVESDTTNMVTAEYGTTTSYGYTITTETTEATDSNTYVHNLKLVNLQPNTAYHYRVSQGGAYSADHVFKTCVNPGTGFRFVFAADCRTNIPPHDAIARLIKPTNPVFLLEGGDRSGSSSYSSIKTEYFIQSQLDLLADVPVHFSPGNHDSWGANTKAFSQGPNGQEDWYSFDCGDLHVVVMNYNVRYGLSSPQGKWIASDLATTTKKWKMVICHAPAYCVGGHGEDVQMKQLTTNIFEPNGVQMVLAGHSHFYQHNLVNGIHHMVVGSFGAPLVTPDSKSYTIMSAESYCYAVIDVTTSMINFAAYNDQGALLESFVIGGGGGDTQPPTAPTNLSATAVSSSQINLSWTASTDNVGVTGYQIFRGGAQIDTTLGTTYADTGLTANTSYNYYVKAYDAAGNVSSASNTATATTQSGGGGSTVLHAADIWTCDVSGNAKDTFVRPETVYWTVKIVDASGNPVSGVIVTTELYRPGSSRVWNTKSGTTDAAGIATMNIGLVKNSATGTYTIKISSVAKSGWTYDTGANVKSETTFVVQ